MYLQKNDVWPKVKGVKIGINTRAGNLNIKLKVSNMLNLADAINEKTANRHLGTTKARIVELWSPNEVFQYGEISNSKVQPNADRLNALLKKMR